MSVRSITIRNGPRPTPARAIPQRRLRPTFWAQFADDRRLIGVKIALVGVLLLVAMALEVPF